MKKLTILGTLLTIAITHINAKESTPTELVTNQSINTNFTGVDYSFEHKIGGKFAMNYSAAVGSNIIHFGWRFLLLINPIHHRRTTLLLQYQ